MRVTTISVSAQAKLPHPNADFASISALVSLTAELSEADDVTGCVRKLQVQADNLAERHLDEKRERLRAAHVANKTANTASRLAEKHGGAK